MRTLLGVPRIAYFGPTGTFTEMALARFEDAGTFDGPVERVSAASPPAALQLVRDRTSVILQLPNEPGSLVRAMTEFATRGIDLTRIESRPTRQEYGTYFFHLDCVGHIDDALVAEALKALHRFAQVRFLGSWAAVSQHGVAPVSDEEDARWLQRLRRGEEER